MHADRRALPGQRRKRADPRAGVRAMSKAPILHLGIAGLGQAAASMLPDIAAHPSVEVVAAADVRPEARQQFASEYDGEVYERVEDLCASPSVDAVYVATPHQFHAA